MTNTNESKWRDPFEFFENPWFKDATQQLCIDGWPAFIVILNGKIREAREHRDELRTQLAAAKEENMQLWAAVNCKEDSGQIKQRMRFAAEITKLTEENARLTKIIAKELNENDELGSEFVMIHILKDKLRVAKNILHQAYYEVEDVALETVIQDFLKNTLEDDK